MPLLTGLRYWWRGCPPPRNPVKFKNTRVVRTAVCALAVVCLSAGQTAPDPTEIQRIQHAARRAQAYEAQRQNAVIQDFVDAWNDFAKEWVDKGTYNVKKARKVRLTWEKLERTGLLPR